MYAGHLTGRGMGRGGEREEGGRGRGKGEKAKGEGQERKFSLASWGFSYCNIVWYVHIYDTP